MYFCTCLSISLVAQLVKNPPAAQETACSTEDQGSIPGCGRSLGEGNDNAFQYSCLENTMDIGAWQAAVNAITESDKTL